MIYTTHKIVPDELCDVTLEALNIVVPMEGFIGNALSDKGFRQSKVRWLRDNEYWHDLNMFVHTAGTTLGFQYFGVFYVYPGQLRPIWNFVRIVVEIGFWF